MALGKIFNTVDARGILFLRLGLGTIFMAHGAQKLLGWFGGAGFEGTIGYFQQNLGIPMELTIVAIVAEFFGGLAVILGLFTRVAASGLAAVMAVAIVKVHWAHGFFLNWTCAGGAGHGFEFNLALLAMALTLMASGPGGLSIDKWISEL